MGLKPISSSPSESSKNAFFFAAGLFYTTGCAVTVYFVVLKPSLSSESSNVFFFGAGFA